MTREGFQNLLFLTQLPFYRAGLVSSFRRERWRVGNLKGPGAKEEIDNVAFVRLEPVEFGRRDRAEIQAVDIGGVGQLALPIFVVRNGGGDERLADFLQHLILRTLNDGD